MIAPDLAERFRLTAGRDLAPLTWLRVGGPADYLFSPRDRSDLQGFLREIDAEIPVTVIGVGSNLIIRDGGLRGVVIRIAGRTLGGVELLEGERIRAGAGMLDAQVAKAAAGFGIAGLEFLRTIPGSIGGAATMNAGCYGDYMADVVESVEAVTREGEVISLSPAEMHFAYRSSTPPEGAIITSVVLKGRADEPAAIESRMEAALARRAESQPVNDRTAGSTFRNPAGFSSTGRGDHGQELMAWKLIDDAGCRGLRLGGAVMNEKHSNFLTNSGNASAKDLENLGEIVRERVLNSCGIELEWEIRRIGEYPAE